jgi:hypothetical protein
MKAMVIFISAVGRCISELLGVLQWLHTSLLKLTSIKDAVFVSGSEAAVCCRACRAATGQWICSVVVQVGLWRHKPRS